MEKIIIVIIVIIFIILLIKPKSIYNTESFISNEKYYSQIFSPLIYNYGYSNIDDPIFSAHPMKLINANLPDKLIKHVRLNNTGNPMYWTYDPPNSNMFNKVDCPYNVVDLTNTTNLNSRYNLVCWSSK